MKITKEQLKQIIKEELTTVAESWRDYDPAAGASGTIPHHLAEDPVAALEAAVRLAAAGGGKSDQATVLKLIKSALTNLKYQS